MKDKLCFARVILILVFPCSALANTYHASRGAGGLELVPSEEISMKEETLKIGLKSIEIDYTFRNDSNHDVETIVAFPFPRQRYYGVDVPRQETNVELTESSPNQLLHFRAMVEGQPVEYETEIKAFLGKKEITASIKQFGFPVYVYAEKDFCKSKARLSAREQKFVEKQAYFSSAGTSEVMCTLEPRWTSQVTYSWKQKFPKKQDIHVSIRYRPILGSESMYSFSLKDGLTRDGEGGGDQVDFDELKEYCIRKSHRAYLRTLAQKYGDNLELIGNHVEYILTTATSWKGPIGQFRLILQKEDVTDLVALCAPSLSFHSTSDTTLEAVQKDFVPRKNLDVLFLWIYDLADIRKKLGSKQSPESRLD